MSRPAEPRVSEVNRSTGGHTPSLGELGGSLRSVPGAPPVAPSPRLVEPDHLLHASSVTLRADRIAIEPCQLGDTRRSWQLRQCTRRLDIVRTVEVTDSEIANALRSALFPPLMRACGFRKLAVVDVDGVERDLVEVVAILDTEEWSDEADQACRRTSLICADTLGPLGLLSLPICRTRSEHDDAVQHEGDIWRMVEPGKPC